MLPQPQEGAFEGCKWPASCKEWQKLGQDSKLWKLSEKKKKPYHSWLQEPLVTFWGVQIQLNSIKMGNCIVAKDLKKQNYNPVTHSQILPTQHQVSLIASEHKKPVQVLPIVVNNDKVLKANPEEDNRHKKINKLDSFLGSLTGSDEKKPLIHKTDSFWIYDDAQSLKNRNIEKECHLQESEVQVMFSKDTGEQQNNDKKVRKSNLKQSSADSSVAMGQVLDFDFMSSKVSRFRGNAAAAAGHQQQNIIDMRKKESEPVVTREPSVVGKEARASFNETQLI